MAHGTLLMAEDGRPSPGGARNAPHINMKLAEEMEGGGPALLRNQLFVQSIDYPIKNKIKTFWMRLDSDDFQVHCFVNVMLCASSLCTPSHTSHVFSCCVHISLCVPFRNFRRLGSPKVAEKPTAKQTTPNVSVAIVFPNLGPRRRSSI